MRRPSGVGTRVWSGDDYPPDGLAVHLEVTNALRDTGWADDDIHQLYNLESCGGRDVETHELLDDPAEIAEQVLEVTERNGNRIMRTTVRDHGTVTGIVEGADALSDDGHARVILTIPTTTATTAPCAPPPKTPTG